MMNTQHTFAHQDDGLLQAVIGMLVLLLLPYPAMAGQVFEVAINQANEVYLAGKIILDGLAVLGTVGVGVMAMSSRMPWGWAFAIIGGLMIVYLSDDIRGWVIAVGKTNAGDVQAVGTALQNEMTGGSVTGSSIYADVRNIANAYGGVALVAIAMVGFFGKFPFKWLFTVAGGLGIVLLAVDIVGPATDDALGGPTQAARNTFTQGEALADNTFLGTRAFLYGIGAFAAIGLGIMAFFGQWRWTLAFGIVGGLVVIAAATGGLQYLTGIAGGGVGVGGVATVN